MSFGGFPSGGYGAGYGAPAFGGGFGGGFPSFGGFGGPSFGGFPQQQGFGGFGQQGFGGGFGGYSAPAIQYGGFQPTSYSAPAASAGYNPYVGMGQSVFNAPTQPYSQVAQPVEVQSYGYGNTLGASYGAAPATSYESAPATSYVSAPATSYVQSGQSTAGYGAGYGYSSGTTYTAENLFGGESWYQGLEGPEQTFRGQLEEAPREEASFMQRTSYYRINGRNLYTSGARHAKLEDLVGRQVEITGKVYDAELEGSQIREIWPASVRRV